MNDLSDPGLPILGMGRDSTEVQPAKCGETWLSGIVCGSSKACGDPVNHQVSGAD